MKRPSWVPTKRRVDQTPAIFPPRWKLAVLVLPGLAVSAAFAQPAQTDSAETDEPIQLNPFVVNTSGDVGYQAQNSLSGSRLNTKLSDLAVPTTAFTQELLQDIGSTSLDELVEYMVSARPDHPEAGNLYWGDDSQRFRIRGLPAFNYSVNFFQTDLRLDHFNTERIEQSRGPNSILFGLGSPGGVVNVSTKRANVQRTFGSITQRVSSNDGWRTVIDLNHPLIDGKLSLRAAAVRDHKETWRHHEYDNQDRIYLTAAWQPSADTRIDAEWEHGLVDKSLSFPRVAIDAYTPWVEAGRVLSDTPDAALGIRRLTAANQLVIDTTTGEVRNVRNTNTTVINRIGGANVYFSDFSILPKEVVMFHGPAFPQTTNYSRGSVFVSHTFSPDFSIEFAANHQKSRQDNMQGRGYDTLQVDTSVTLPDGTPNPNAGRPFMQGFPGLSWAEDRATNARLSAVYQLDLGRAGTHQIAGMYQRDRIEESFGQMRPQIVVNPFNLNSPENAQNLVYFRTYYDLGDSPESITAGDWRQFDLNHIVDGSIVRQAKFLNYIQGAQDNKFERDSAIGVLQSRFFQDRLVTVVGYRVDWQDSFYSPTGYRGDPFGPFALGAYETPRSDTPVDFKATNLTFSGLFRLTDWLALTYNEAENSALADTNAAIIGPDGTGRPPNPRGHSRDIGFKVNLGSRLSMNVLRYETSAEKDTAVSNGQIEGRFPVIWDALDAAGVSAPGGGLASEVPSLFNRYTFDSSAEGYELELVANPTPNWRVFFNYSRMTLERTNIGEEGRAYLAQYRDYWLQGDNGRVLIDGSGGLAPVADDGDTIVETVSEQVASIDREIQDFYVIAEGEQPRGQNKDRINLRTNYLFDDGILDGFSIGGGVRYRSPEVIAYEATSTGSGVDADVMYGERVLLVDFNAGYRGKFDLRGHEIRWSVQLNIDNLLDETDILPMRAVNGTVVSFRFQQPREVMLTTKFEF